LWIGITDEWKDAANRKNFNTFGYMAKMEGQKRNPLQSESDNRQRREMI
jgi:hypothetical protein